ncbi:MAG: metallophosphatase family protein [Bacteroidetes bacterium]|nr:metallophosphatase family protein [Bacteroidota bacterium]MCL5737713.1 metallophosphatase family protein [Bacteroidota bacterium]
MKTLIVSDIHANLPALGAVLRDVGDYDLCFFLGDSVDYGSFPKECVEFLRENMDQGVMGNHDNAMANDKDCGCRADFKIYAEETLAWHRTLLGREDVQFLKSLPPTLFAHIDGMYVYMTHGAPDGNMYKYLREEEIGEAEIRGLEKYDLILLGHTHFQFKKQVGNVTIVNPGSVGLSREDHNACYAVLEDGEVTLHRVPYNNQRTVEVLWQSPVSTFTKEGLSKIAGWLPPQMKEKG